MLDVDDVVELEVEVELPGPTVVVEDEVAGPAVVVTGGGL
jgi:hypothetical protein